MTAVTFIIYTVSGQTFRFKTSGTGVREDGKVDATAKGIYEAIKSSDGHVWNGIYIDPEKIWAVSVEDTDAEKLLV